jgi:ribosomal protein S18 acetylase RimI-like enzyme
MSSFETRPLPPQATRALRQAVLRPHQTVAEMAANEPRDVFAVGAFRDGELVAVGLIGLDGGSSAWRVRGMATAPDARGQGAGAAVLDALLTHARQSGGERVWCNARTPAISLYARAGFAVVSEEFTLPQIGPHVVMEMRL